MEILNHFEAEFVDDGLCHFTKGNLTLDDELVNEPNEEWRTDADYNKQPQRSALPQNDRQPRERQAQHERQAQYGKIELTLRGTDPLGALVILRQSQ